MFSYLPQVLVQYGGRGLIGKLIVLILAFHLSTGMASAQTVTIAALGDSLTQGYGLPDGDGLVPQLQAWLDAQGADAVVLNAGVSGDTTAGGRARIDWTLTDEVDALIVALGGNDVLRGIPPEVAKANLEGILEVATGRGLPVLLVGLSAPANYGAEYKAAFDTLYPDLAARFQTLYFPGLLNVLTEGGAWADILQTLMQADAIHPNKAGVTQIVAALGPKVNELAIVARGAAN
jgi:acyl-CoA thioesterase I